MAWNPYRDNPAIFGQREFIEQAFFEQQRCFEPQRCFEQQRCLCTQQQQQRCVQPFVFPEPCRTPQIAPRSHVTASYSASNFTPTLQAPKSVFLVSGTTIPVGGLTLAAGASLTFTFTSDYPHPLISGEAALTVINLTNSLFSALSGTATITGTFGSPVTITVTLTNATGAAITVPAGNSSVAVMVGYQ